MEKLAARRQLGIGSSKKILLVGCHSFSERRKGIALLLEVLEYLPKGIIYVFFVGKNLRRLERKNKSIDTHNFGYVKDDAKLALIYNAADLFVHPSFADWFDSLTRQIKRKPLSLLRGDQFREESADVGSSRI